MVIKRLISRLKNIIFLPCQGYWTKSTTNGPSEFDCEADYDGKITCDECLINGGMYNPWTGKKDYLRYLFYRNERAKEEKLSKRLDGMRGRIKNESESI